MVRAFTLAILLCAVSAIGAEIVIDDFVAQPARIDRLNFSLFQEGIGDIETIRSTRIVNRRKAGDPVAYVDINGEVPSVLVSSLGEVPPLSGGRPDHVAVSIDSAFVTGFATTKDLTDGGTNDTVYYDFAFFEGPTPPRTIRLHAKTSTSWSVVYVTDLPVSNEPFTLAVPFDDYQDRGGRDVRPDFTNVGSLDFEAFTGGLWDFEEDEGWRFGLDAVRVGPAVPEPAPGEFNADGTLDALDIDLLSLEVIQGLDNTLFDLTMDGLVNQADRDEWVVNLKGTMFGDANLDLVVDDTDFAILSGNLFQAGTSWSTADFTGDGVTDGSDFNIWNNNRGFNGVAATVPEPGRLSMWLLILFALHSRVPSNIGKNKLVFS